jgi:hypothetical protein
MGIETNMLQAFQFNNLPVAIVLWVFVYSCDFFLTLYGNQLRTKYAAAHIGMDGSYELNPFFQRDVNANKKASRRFLFMLALFSLWLVFMWVGAQAIRRPEVFSISAGYLLLMEVPILERHVQNVSLFNAMKTPGVTVGFITRARWTDLLLLGRLGGFWLLAYGALFFLTGNWLFVGGVLSMFSIFFRYSSQGNALRRKSPMVVLPKEVPSTQTVGATTATASSDS